MNNTKKTILSLLVVGLVLSGISAFLPIRGTYNFCKPGTDFSLYNDTKRGLPLVFYKEAQQCGEIGCSFRPVGDACRSDLRILRREFNVVNLVLDTGFWILATVGVYFVVNRTIRK